MKNKRLFITGIPASGKTTLANKLALELGAVVVSLDNAKDSFREDEKYEPWISFYYNKDEEKYITETTPDERWQDLVKQSEALFKIFKTEIDKYKDESRTVIFECVNLLPHIANKNLDFPGVVLLGENYETILERNRKSPRWGHTKELQEKETRDFFYNQGNRYKEEAEKYNYNYYNSADEAFKYCLNLLQ
jgi:tRNA uridine 5-carbamoylmethylation protein Kti12